MLKTRRDQRCARTANRRCKSILFENYYRTPFQIYHNIKKTRRTIEISEILIHPLNIFLPTQTIYTHDDPDNEELDAQGSKIITAITALLIHRAGSEESLSPAANHLELFADSDL